MSPDPARLTFSGGSKDTLTNYITNPELPIYDPLPEILPWTPDEGRLYHAPLCPASTDLFPERDVFTGEIVDFVELPLLDPGADSKNSMSFRRAPGPLEETVRGSAMNFPFWPGGFEEPSKDIEMMKINEKFEFGTELLTVPPGFEHGMNFDGTSDEMDIFCDDNNTKTIDLISSLEEGNAIAEWIEVEKQEEKQDVSESKLDEVNKIFDSVIITDEPTSSLKSSKPTRFVEVIDTSFPVNDFEARIPEPAIKYPFKLDVFQKQAIIKLEERQHVFVAAHTSAGKTVVAEYAIALSQKHMTKAIYTSPVKALSNQKYQDFRKIFKDVGLITGDLQINATASCLIMTTEILRSMLYCGSDNTRDLEYVILDEVHYINNDDRGHVWEEVLILLPDHVQIIMLSATVPNPIEFASWVGNIKKKKVFVISTIKRPVPLVHYLYTGINRKTQKDLFLIVSEDGKFVMENYMKARHKIEEMESDKKNFYKQRDDESRWNTIIKYLKENDKLPVVAFTLSRNRCDNNAELVKDFDLNTQKESNDVKAFFLNCIQNLKPPDRVIPQVLSMQKALQRGIGIHHSGILPILKEIVEISFQRGWVKVLFATETFAMGVNMPTKTVVFDSYIKFDGMEKRILQPAEYTQMAGRAGRRGMDKTGTVILMASRKLPGEVDLRTMIMGKPKMLESKFRLTYGMILNLLRVDKFLSVEEIMSHSFKEYEIQKQIPEHTKKLELTRKQYSSMQELSEQLKPLVTFYDTAHSYFVQVDSVMKDVLALNSISKELKQGRVLIISHEHHYNKLAILLFTQVKHNKGILLTVLVLDHQIENERSDGKMFEVDRGTLWHRMLSLAHHNKYFKPDGTEGYSVLEIGASCVVEITKTTIKLDKDAVIKDWEKKKSAHFRDWSSPPEVLKAVKALNKLNDEYMSQPGALQFISYLQEAQLQEDYIANGIRNMIDLRKQLKKIAQNTKISNFEHEFALVFDRKSLQDKLKDLEFKTSKRNLILYPEYNDKLKILEELKFIDQQHDLMMKGRVACEMGQNELIITELVLCNMFSDMNSAEIAGLLSSLVFQGKTLIEPELTDKLKKCVEELVRIDQMIFEKERKYGLESSENCSRLNFNLVQVVYEWAQNKPFVNILKLTDFQPGIIVRCIQQLDEILRDVKTAAMKIGNPTLQQKMEDASNAIKRDIVFAASLYTSDET